MQKFALNLDKRCQDTCLFWFSEVYLIILIYIGPKIYNIDLIICIKKLKDVISRFCSDAVMLYSTVYNLQSFNLQVMYKKENKNKSIIVQAGGKEMGKN